MKLLLCRLSSAVFKVMHAAALSPNVAVGIKPATPASIGLTRLRKRRTEDWRELVRGADADTHGEGGGPSCAPVAGGSWSAVRAAQEATVPVRGMHSRGWFTRAKSGSEFVALVVVVGSGEDTVSEASNLGLGAKVLEELGRREISSSKASSCRVADSGDGDVAGVCGTAYARVSAVGAMEAARLEVACVRRWMCRTRSATLRVERVAAPAAALGEMHAITDVLVSPPIAFCKYVTVRIGVKE
jgi:hypothetical protein